MTNDEAFTARLEQKEHDLTQEGYKRLRATWKGESVEGSLWVRIELMGVNFAEITAFRNLDEIDLKFWYLADDDLKACTRLARETRSA